MRILNLLMGALVVSVVVATVADANSRRSKTLKGLFERGSGIFAEKKTYGGDIIGPLQLDQCILLKRAIEANDTKLDATDEYLTKRRGVLEDAAGKIEGMQRFLAENQDGPFADQAALDTFNGKVDKYNEFLKAFDEATTTFNQRLDRFNQRVDKQNGLIDRFDTTCAGKRFYEEDLEIALRNIRVREERRKREQENAS